MTRSRFHSKPFDEGTLTKLRIFELYAREWLPVFLSKESPPFDSLHLFDFFSGPGVDSEGTPGSPIRLLKQLTEYQDLKGFPEVSITVHFTDKSVSKVGKLEANVRPLLEKLPAVKSDVRASEFKQVFEESLPILSDASTAKLVFIDQFGVSHVTPDVFKALVTAPACDVLFFISSSTLRRFADHPAIKQKIDRSTDYYHVHNAVLNYYRQYLDPEAEYYLAPFSIKKGSNIYGLIFGSAHPLGIDKFLQVAWKEDQFSGSADFDIDRANMKPDQMMFELDVLQPTKVKAFERELERRILNGELEHELDLLRVCFEHGVRPQHAKPVLSRLKKEKRIELDFQVPDVRRRRSPRTLRLR